jgi:hypothetical protein
MIDRRELMKLLNERLFPALTCGRIQELADEITELLKAPKSGPTDEELKKQKRLNLPIPNDVMDEAISVCMRTYGRTCSHIEAHEEMSKVIDAYKDKVLASDDTEPVNTTASELSEGERK